MKILKNPFKLKFLLRARLLLIVVVIIIAAVLSIQIVNHVQQQPKDAYEILQKQRFVLVQDKNDWGKEWSTGVGFDLKDKELYNSYFTVIKRNKLYGGYGNYATKEMYKRSFNREISSILVNLKISPDEIKRNNYQITRTPDSLVNKELLKEEYPPEFELEYQYQQEDQFSKVRITYNKEFLPTRIEWYYKGKEGLKWYTWRTYSYPFKNKSDFDKRLDKEIKTIKEIQEENEGD